MKSLTWPSGSLDIQFGGIIFVSPGAYIPPLETETYKPMSSGHGDKKQNFSSGSLGVTASDANPMSTP